MNPFERAIRTVDAWQQRHRAPAFIFAVFKKFGDDQAGNLVALLTYFAFIATFPLLLALTGILGLVLKGDPSLQARIQTSALAEFPIIGTQLRSQIGVSSLGHSTAAVIIGIFGAILGGQGLANALQNAFNSVWNVPKVDRPGFPNNYLRTFGLLGLLGIGAIATTAAASLTGAGHLLGLSGPPIRILAFVLSTAVDMGLFFVAFRLATAKVVATRDLLLGAILSSIAWQILLSLAGLIIGRDLKHAQAVAGFFGVVLGLLAWFGLQATATIYAAEADVVRARHLWPRSITAPPLTSADKRVLRDATEGETRRPEQKVTVEFTPAADQDPLHPPDTDPANRTGAEPGNADAVRAHVDSAAAQRATTVNQFADEDDVKRRASRRAGAVRDQTTDAADLTAPHRGKMLTAVLASIVALAIARRRRTTRGQS